MAFHNLQSHLACRYIKMCILTRHTICVSLVKLCNTKHKCRSFLWCIFQTYFLNCTPYLTSVYAVQGDSYPLVSNKDTGNWAKFCILFQCSKVHVNSPHSQIELPFGRFDHIHVDLGGPLSPSDNNCYIMTIVIPDDHYVSRFGVPLRITTNQGTQFLSRLINEFSRLLRSYQINTTAYNNPKANGMVGRFHRHLKASLMARENTVY